MDGVKPYPVMLGSTLLDLCGASRYVDFWPHHLSNGAMTGIFFST
jgi:hypothetical protein